MNEEILINYEIFDLFIKYTGESEKMIKNLEKY